MKTLWIRYRTVAGAIVATVLLGTLVYVGRLPSTRALVPLVFAWMFALHSMDYREAAERHARVILGALARAGAEEREGRKADALGDVGVAMHEAADCVEELAARQARAMPSGRGGAA